MSVDPSVNELKSGDGLPEGRLGEMPRRQSAAGLETQGFAKSGDRLVQFARLGECPAEVGMRGGKVGLGAARLATRGDRLVDPPRLDQGAAEIAVGHHIVRLEADRLSVG